MRSSRRRLMRFSSSSLVIIAAMLCQNEKSLAQSLPASTVANGSQGDVAEIIVTAEKRSETATHVPASLAVVGALAIKERQISGLQDIQSEVPSLVIGSLFGATLVSLRGISTGITSGAEDPSVALHIDGVYQPRPRTIDLAGIDVGRIEALSGPQGTLYGRNATGGVINYVLNAPTKTFEGNISALAANYDRYQVKGVVSGPITDNLQFRVAAIYDNQSTGFVKNLQPGAPQSTIESHLTEGARLALAYQPTSNFSVLAEIILEDYKAPTDFSSFAPTTDAYSASLFQPTTSAPHKIYNNSPDTDSGRVMAPTLIMDWTPNANLSIKSITGYQKFNDDEKLDTDASGANLDSSVIRNRSETFTQEFDANVNSFNDKLKSIYGLFYFSDHVQPETRASYGFIVPGAVIPADYKTNQRAESYAAFTDQTYSLTPNLRLQFGARYDIDHKNSFQNVIFGGAETCGASGIDSAKTWYSFTPKFAAQYDINPNLMAYVQWQKGFKSGGVAANACANAYNPEKIQGPEVGIKGNLFERRVTFAAAVYHYDIDDLQVQQFHNLTLLVNNAGASEITGFELSGRARVTDWLRADLATNVMRAVYTNFSNCNAMLFLGACSASDTRPLSEQFQNLDGNALNRAPPYTVNLGLEVHHSYASMGSFVARGEFYWSGKINYDEFKSAALTQPAYMSLNAFLTYTFPVDKYQLRFFAKNLTNTDIKTSGFALAGAGQVFVGTWAPPRTFGAEIAASF